MSHLDNDPVALSMAHEISRLRFLGETTEAARKEEELKEYLESKGVDTGDIPDV